jgi:anti-sigma B factor antagonist
MADSTLPLRKLTIDATEDNGVTVTLVCRGELVAENSDEFKVQIKTLAASHQYVLADMSAVSYVDSSGLGDIVGAFLAAKTAGCSLQIINAHPRFKDLLNTTRLAAILKG